MVAKNPVKEFRFTKEHLLKIAKYPHLLGAMVGKDRLTTIHSEWISNCWRAQNHYALQAHRGSYKTTAITEVGAVWWLLFHPNDRIGIIRKTATEAEATLSTIRKMFESEEVRALFKFAHGEYPEMTTKRGNKITFNFKGSITKEGSLNAFGVDGSITGTHLDKVICDDVITRQDRYSKAERNATLEFMRELYTNIIDPGKFAIHVGTPWHKNDAWSLTPPNEKWDCHQTGLLTAEDLTEKRSTTSSILFAINYELTHESADDMEFKNLSYIEPWKHGTPAVYAQIDCAFSGTHHTALTIMSLLPDGRIQAKGWVFLENVKEKIEWVQQICKQFMVKEIYIETNPDKGYTADLLEDGENGIICRRYSESTHKHTKIITHLKGQWYNISWDIDCQPEYVEQLLDFREGQEPDDAPDSAASLIRARFPKVGDRNSALNNW